MAYSGESDIQGVLVLTAHGIFGRIGHLGARIVGLRDRFGGIGH